MCGAECKEVEAQGVHSRERERERERGRKRIGRRQKGRGDRRIMERVGSFMRQFCSRIQVHSSPLQVGVKSIQTSAVPSHATPRVCFESMSSGLQVNVNFATHVRRLSIAPLSSPLLSIPVRLEPDTRWLPMRFPQAFGARSHEVDSGANRSARHARLAHRTTPSLLSALCSACRRRWPWATP